MPEIVNNKKNTNKYTLIIIILLIIIIISVLLYRLNNKPANTPIAESTPQTFTDPANHLTLSLPFTWTTNSDFGKQTTGIGTPNEQSNRTEVINLSGGTTGINVYINEKAPTCETAEKPNATLAGFPAAYNDKHYAWTINTTTSTIIIGYYYPGAGVYHRPVGVNPTEVPQAEKDASRKIINEIIATLKLQNAIPLQCP